MSTKEAYRKGQKDMLVTISGMIAWTGIFITMLIKAGIFVL